MKTDTKILVAKLEENKQFVRRRCACNVRLPSCMTAIKAYGGVEVQLHSFLTEALGFTPRLLYPRGKAPPVPTE
jgi:hypothetical protein